VNSFLGQLTGRLPLSVRYVNQLEHGEVGFRGAAWDEHAAPEYAFYNLGAIAPLQAPFA
jgi:hypothetical protein